jgi:hypothetical protein
MLVDGHDKGSVSGGDCQLVCTFIFSSAVLRLFLYSLGLLFFNSHSNKGCSFVAPLISSSFKTECPISNGWFNEF